MTKLILAAAAALVLLLAAGTSFFAVDRAEFAYVTQFGRPVVTYDGATDAGLHHKLPWPIQAVQRIDHRLQVFDLAGAELLTHDPKGMTIDKTLTISAYVCWRIPDADSVDRFIRTVGTPDQAEKILGQQISSRLGAEIGNMQLDDLISIAPSKEVEQRMDKLNHRLLDSSRAEPGNPAGRETIKENARRTYGIDLVAIRLRRFNH